MRVKGLKLDSITTGFPMSVIYVLSVSLEVNENVTTMLSVTYNRGEGESWILKDKLLELIDLIGDEELRFKS